MCKILCNFFVFLLHMSKICRTFAPAKVSKTNLPSAAQDVKSGKSKLDIDIQAQACAKEKRYKPNLIF